MSLLSLFSALSSPQRHCRLMLMFYLPETTITLDSLSELNGVDRTATRQDITRVDAKIQRYHRLSLSQHTDGSYGITGAELDRQLCLLHWLRRALRLVPGFVRDAFAPALRQHLKTRQIATALYDEHNLQALIHHCAHSMKRELMPQHCLLLSIYMQYALSSQFCAQLNAAQRAWLSGRREHQAAKEVLHVWQRRGSLVPDSNQYWLFALLFSQLPSPCIPETAEAHEQQLLNVVNQTMLRFEHLSGMRFNDTQSLCNRLYSHLAQAIERCLFGIGIDKDLTGEIARLYPRLLRTTQAAVVDCEQCYGLCFPQEELALIAVIFGAGLMQDNALQEKQVLLLTSNNKRLEREIEQQIRELTLLPLNITYLSVEDFQQYSAPKGTALVVTPYATPLPLFSPPLILAQVPLKAHQQQCVRTLLES